MSTTVRLSATPSTALHSPSEEAESAQRAAWSLHAQLLHWVPHITQKGPETSAVDPSCDRFDMVGTTGVNELVLRHGTLPSSDLRISRYPVLFRRLHQRGKNLHAAGPAPAAAGPSSGSSSHFSLDRYLSNLVRALVHPLHNFLQCHHGLHNADEIQVMLMPKDGPLAAAEGARVSAAAPRKEGVRSGTSSLRRCYVATNNETVTEDGLQDAVRGWGVAGVFQISEFVLVRGEKGRHAEQKLLDHLRAHILPPFSPPARHRDDSGLMPAQKALVVGERLPCVACRLFATLYEDVAVLLPSHGHMYLSTIAPSLAALAASSSIAEEGKKVVRGAYADPAVAAKLLLSPHPQRVLR